MRYKDVSEARKGRRNMKVYGSGAYEQKERATAWNRTANMNNYSTFLIWNYPQVWGISVCGRGISVVIIASVQRWVSRAFAHTRIIS